MQEKTWYSEKWVGRQASFSPSRYVNTDSLSYLVFTCKSNSDCRGNGYCKREFHLEVKRVVGVCKCEPNFMYALDCSIFGCKYHLQHHCRFLVSDNMKKFLCRFDTSFDIKIIVQKIAIQIIFKSHEPLQS